MKSQQRLDRLHAQDALRVYRRRKRKGEIVSISSVAREFNIQPSALQRRNRIQKPRVRMNQDDDDTDKEMTSLGEEIQAPTPMEESEFDAVHEYLKRHEEELGPLCSTAQMILSTGSLVIQNCYMNFQEPRDPRPFMTEQWVHNFVTRYPQYAEHKRAVIEQVIRSDGAHGYGSDDCLPGAGYTVAQARDQGPKRRELRNKMLEEAILKAQLGGEENEASVFQLFQSPLVRLHQLVDRRFQKRKPGDDASSEDDSADDEIPDLPTGDPNTPDSSPTEQAQFDAVNEYLLRYKEVLRPFNDPTWKILGIASIVIRRTCPDSDSQRPVLRTPWIRNFMQRHPRWKRYEQRALEAIDDDEPADDYDTLARAEIAERDQLREKTLREAFQNAGLVDQHPEVKLFPKYDKYGQVEETYGKIDE